MDLIALMITSVGHFSSITDSNMIHISKKLLVSQSNYKYKLN